MSQPDPTLLLLGRIDGKLDGLRETMDRHLSDDAAALGRIDTRLRALETATPSPEERRVFEGRVVSLERCRWRTAGMAALAGALLGALLKVVAG